jgi:hypothetical protein
VNVKLSDLQKFAFCDPASGKKEQVKRVRARSAIIVVGADALTRIFVLHAWAERCSTEKLMDRILEVNDFWVPRVFGIEANAMQSLFADAMSLEARHRDKQLPLTAVYQPTKLEKDFRIRTAIQPVIAFGRLFLQATQHELESELKSFPMSPVKDMVDALASAIELVPPRAPQRQTNDEMEAHLAYLRASGAPPEYIEEVASGYGR